MGKTLEKTPRSDGGSERNYLFDNCKALLIFLVAAVHLCAAARNACGALPAADALMLTASSFHMPLFMLISGYFSKRVKRERITEAVIVYLTAQSLFMVYDFFFTCGMSLRGMSLVSILSPGFSMWYLFAIIFLRMFHSEMARLKYSVAVAALVSIAVMGCAMDTAGRQAIVKTIAHSLYFIIGMKLTPGHIQKLRELPKAVSAAGLAAGFGVLVLITEVFHIINPNTLRLMTIRAVSVSQLGGRIKPYCMYVFVTVLALFMSAMIVGIMPDKKTVFSIFGQNSVTIYIAQAFVYLFFRPAAGKLAGIMPPPAVNFIALALAAVCVAAAGHRRVAELFHQWVKWVEKSLFQRENA